MAVLVDATEEDDKQCGRQSAFPSGTEEFRVSQEESGEKPEEEKVVEFIGGEADSQVWGGQFRDTGSKDNGGCK